MIRDYTSIHQALKLHSLLSRYIPCSPLNTHVPPGYHFIYFNPSGALDTDGYFSYQNPSSLGLKPKARRMWTHGEISFKPMLFNHEYTCVEKISMKRELKNQTYIGITREIAGTVEKRHLMYTDEPYSEAQAVACTLVAEHSQTLVMDESLIMSYSALTYNPHKIHYDQEYARSEGFSTTIAQGPLSVSLLLSYYSYFYGSSFGQVKYKNKAAVYRGTRVTLCASPGRVWCLDGDRLMVDCVVSN